MKLFIILLASCLGLNLCTVISSTLQLYKAMFCFGDSLSDTGNYLLSGAPALPAIGKLPYGETFFKHPTGRCSDGRLVVDFVAEALGLPDLRPYLALNKEQDYSNGQHGVNFAVSGATALDPEFFYQRNIGSISWTNDSLSTQLGWFTNLKSSLCKTKQECDNYFKTTLFLVGEIGGNDYNYPFLFFDWSIRQVKALVPLVVEAISKATSALIEEGAVDLVVPGNLPIGCSTVYLTLFQSPNRSYYDQNGCLKAFNAFSKYHNSELKFSLETLRQKYPHTRIVYADFYGAAKPFYHAPHHYGFKNVLTACCGGGGGPYNFDISAICGSPGSTTCKDPYLYASWDGIHLTEAAYRYIAASTVLGLAVAY